MPSTSTWPSVVIIGMRGVGKTTVGNALASKLSVPFIDMDDVFESHTSTTISSFVHTNGWPKFREVEAHLLRDVLARHGTNAVISTGGGIIETATSRSVLSRWPIVIFLHQDIVRIAHYLLRKREKENISDVQQEHRRPALPLEFEDTYERRKVHYYRCASDVVHVNIDVDTMQRKLEVAVPAMVDVVERRVNRRTKLTGKL